MEQVILDYIRKTLVVAHQLALVWQDEWHGLTMEQLREVKKVAVIDDTHDTSKSNNNNVGHTYTSSCKDTVRPILFYLHYRSTILLYWIDLEHR